MNIKKITLQEGGLKGLQVVYNEPEKQGGKILTSDMKKTKRHPIHLGLEVPFKDLRYHLLKIRGMIKEDMTKWDIDCQVENCNVTSVDINPDYFVINGFTTVFEKEAPLSTPKVDTGDEYEHFEAVVNIIKKIIEETKLYLAGDVHVEDIEIVQKWIGAGKEKGFDIDSFNALSPEEKKDLCQKILEESFGAVVIMDEEADISQVSTDEVTANFKFGENETFEVSLEKETIILPAKN